MARQLDSAQIVGLYRQRLTQGELYTPQLSAPSDMVNYFIYVGNQIATDNEKQGKAYEKVIIRYAMVENLPLNNDAEIEAAIKKHHQVFRTTLSRIRADYAKQNKQLIKFKALTHASYKMEGDLPVMIYAWEFQLKSAVNKTIASLGDDTLIIGSAE